MDNLQMYKDKRKELNTAIKTAKKKSWNQLLDEMNAKGNVRDYWKFVNGMKNPKTNEGQRCWDEPTYLSYLNHMTRNCSADNEIQIPHMTMIGNPIPFSVEEYDKFIRKKSSRSAPGYDKISFGLLKSLNEDNVKLLVEGLNDNFYRCEVIDEWRRIKICPIPKKDKDLSVHTNFRPIALIPVLIKVINGIVKGRLDEWVERNNILSPSCHAYRRNRSAVSCINEALQLISHLKQHNKYIAMATVDIDGAYDFVDIGTLHNTLTAYNAPIHEKHWIIEFLKKRILLLDGVEKTVFGGLPQGSSLSPTLFNIYTAKLHENNIPECSIIQYADDFLLICNGESKEETISNLEKAVNKFNDNANRINLSINASKTQLLYIGNQKKEGHGFIMFNNQQINFLNTITYLGRVIAGNLSVRAHIEKCKFKIQSASKVIQILSGPKRGLHPSKALTTYKAVFRSVLDYARSSFAMGGSTALRNIMSMQNIPLRHSLGLIKNTPTHVIYALAAELPPGHRALAIAGKELAKIFYFQLPIVEYVRDSASVNTTYDYCYAAHRDIFDKLVPHQFFVPSNKLIIGENPMPELGLTKETASSVILKKIYAEKLNAAREDGFYIYATDGSVGPCASGFAYVNLNNNNVTKTFKILKVVSSFTTELLAIKEALKDAAKRKVRKVAIFTDSLSSCSAVTREPHNYIIYDINKLIDQHFCSVLIQYTPSHKNIFFNELADIAAKRAVDNGFLYDFRYTLDEAINEITNSTWTNWNEEFQKTSETKGRFFHQVYPEVTKKPWFQKGDLSSNEVKIVNRLLSNATFSKSNMFWFGLEDTRLCEKCDLAKICDPNHLIFECKQFDNIRTNFNFFRKFNNLKDCLRLKNTDDIEEILDFITETNIPI